MHAPKINSYLLSGKLLAFFFLAGLGSAFGQASVTGPTCIVAGNTYTYTLFSAASNFNYTITNGYNSATGLNYGSWSGSSSTNINVTWNSGITSGSISLTSAYGNASLSVSTAASLNAGTISNASQSINYNATPATLNCSIATGGSCSPAYSYQWQQSTNNVSFTNISGATSQNLSFSSGLTQTMYYRRYVSVSSGGTGYSNTATVIVYPQLVGGSVTPAAPYSNYNGSPGALTLGSVSGGTGSYTYQWQSSPDNTTWTNVSGATSTTYTPSALMSPLYYRVQVTSNGALAYSNYSYVSIYPPVQGGSISPVSQVVGYNATPSTMTLSGVSGGNGSFTYQWQNSNNNSSWNTISGAMSSSYTPSSGITTNTYYRVQVTSNGSAGYSSSTLVNVTGQLAAGTVVPGFIRLASGTSPGVITCTPAMGGGCSGSYTYQWQSSPDNVSWSNIGGATSLSYSPGSLFSAVYYRVQVTCSSVIAYSSVGQVTIGAINTNLNYVRERTITKPGVTDTTTANSLTDPGDVEQTTTYFDGLGRSIQSVARQASPLQKDMVTVEVYDALGREPIRYLPYTSTSTTGDYKTNPIGEQSSFNASQFSNDQFYYGSVIYEPSPLNRQSVTAAAGNSWTGSGRGISAQYLVSTSADSVRVWTIAAAAGSLPTTTAAYPAGALYKNITQDEAGHQVAEYKDQQGKVILKKVQLWNTPAAGPTGWLNTYYIYDDMDNLRFVIQPKAVEWLLTNSWNFANSGGSTVAAELCFRYEYDERKHLLIKKVPGAGETWMVYDQRDRMVLSQDSVLRNQHKWVFTRYDILNRIDSTGTINDSANYNNRVFHQNLASASAAYPSLTSYGNEVLTQSFYDSYAWTTTAGLPSTMATNYTSNSAYFITAYTTNPYAIAITAHPITRGLPTGTMIKVIGTASQYLSTVSFYDDRARVIQTQAINFTGAIDTLTSQYNFSGVVLRSLLNHRKSGNTTQNHTVLTKMGYDAGHRVKNIYKNVDNLGDQLIDSVQYNELGQLTAKYLGSNIDNLIYDFNIRGWLTGINKQYVGGGNTHYFGQELNYDVAASVVNGSTYTTQQYNGNVAGLTWKTKGDSTKRKYDFTYDNVNRLTGANFVQNTGSGGWSNALVNYTVSNLTYDANGGILSMLQQGFKWNGSSLIDSLVYSYYGNSNRLSQVKDGDNDSLSKLGDFHRIGAQVDTGYRYDGNGNAVKDLNKGIDTIIYNYLNLPQQIHIIGKGNVLYTYSAAGTKITKRTMDSLSRRATTTLYLDGFVYQQTDTITNPTGGVDTLQFLLHEEGKMRWALHYYQNGTSKYGWENDFFEKDHLGNTRMVLTTQKDTSYYAATMEAAYRAKENALFYNIPQTAYSRTLAGYPVDTSMTNPNDSVIMLNGTTGRTQGPAIILKVMAGDTINIGAKAYYTTLSGTGTNPSITDALTSLANGVVGITAGSKGTFGQLNTTTSPLYGALNSFITNKDGTIANKPRAYLNWMFLDDQYQYDAANSGAIALGNYAVGTLNTLAQPGKVAGKNGFLYVWVSNETQGWPVYFDNLSVQIITGPILEETHYYPFGLAMAGISDKALKTSYQQNKFRYNSKELQNGEFSDGTGIEEYDYGARHYDPQLGVWGVQDPHGSYYPWSSPYTYAFNNPMLVTDPDGKDGVVTGAGTKEDPYKVKANYYYYNLNKDQEKGLKAAVSSYNNGGKAFEVKTKSGTVYVKFELNATKADDAKTATTMAEGDKVTVGDATYHFGNTVTDGNVANGDLGDADKDDIKFDGQNASDLLEKKPGGNAEDLFKGVAIHEIGHNLGGVHGDPGHIMSQQETTEQQKENCQGKCGTGTFSYHLSYVDVNGVRAIVGRIDNDLGSIASRYLTDKETLEVEKTNGGGTNGRLRSIHN